MIKKTIFTSIILLTSLNANALHNSEDSIELRLNSLVKEVVKRNGEIVKQHLQTSIAQEQVEYEKGIYDPIINSNFTRQSTNVPNSVENELIRFQETYQDRVDYFDVGVSGLLPTGAKWSFLYTNNKKESSLIDQNKDYEKEYDSSVELSLEQPLLKDAGQDITEAKIALSKFERQISENEYKQKLMELQGLTIQMYWRLYGAQKIYQSWKKSISLAQKSLKDLEFRAKNGKVAQTEVLEAKSAMTIRMSEYENAKNKFNEAQNQLLTLLNLPYNPNDKFEFIIADEPENDASNLLGFDEYLNLAFENWPEYLSAKSNIKKEALQKKYSKNQSLPQLNIIGTIERTSLQNNRSDSYDQAFGPEFTSWSFGVQFSKPLLNSQAKSSLRMAHLKLQEAKVNLNALENNLINSINTKIDNLRSSKKQYKLYREGLAIKKKLLNVDQNKLLMGKINSKLMFEKEEEYMNFQRKYLSSIINWKTSEALLEIAIGNLLNKYDINLKDLNSLSVSNQINISEVFKNNK